MYIYKNLNRLKNNKFVFSKIKIEVLEESIQL